MARNTAVMAGIDKNITGKVTIGGVTYTAATLSAVFSDENDAIHDLLLACGLRGSSPSGFLRSRLNRRPDAPARHPSTATYSPSASV